MPLDCGKDRTLSEAVAGLSLRWLTADGGVLTALSNLGDEFFSEGS